MLFTPHYTVSYKGAFRAGGVPFEIDEGDRKEMERHGKVDAPAEEAEAKEKPARKGGRQKRADV